jgi:hypothetical protein
MNTLRLLKTIAICFLAIGLQATVQAQTYTWADNAQGQYVDQCYCGGITPFCTNYWPNDTYWTQSAETSSDCNGIFYSQPSNWNPYPPIGEYPGGPGAVGVNAVLGPPANTYLQGDATLDLLTIQTNGAFVLGPGILAAQGYDFRGDGVLGTSGNNQLQLLPGGLMKKSGGAGIYQVMPEYLITDGTVEVDSGELTLFGQNGNASMNGTFNISTGALLDLTSGNTALWSGQLTGSGGGHVLLASGGLNCSAGVTLSFPQNLFWWTGGSLNGIVTNIGTVTAFASGSLSFSDNGNFDNFGLFLETNSGTIVASGPLQNESSGIYQFEGDGGLQGYPFVNYGLVWKSSGTGISTIANEFSTTGIVEVDSGTLEVPNGYATGGGSLKIEIGGTGAGQTGQLLVNGAATLNGTLNVALAGNFAPAVGNQFQVLACSSLTGTFTSLNVPNGISVTYSNTGVYLTIISPVPVTIQPPVLGGGGFHFGFNTTTNQSYTVQQNTNIVSTNWDYYTNISGNGSLMQFEVPVTNYPQQFFRVREP